MSGNGQLPSNVDAERAVLGSILLDPSVMPGVSAIIKTVDFSLFQHRVIFEAILTLQSQGRIIDLTALASVLRETGNIEVAGDYQYLANLEFAVISTTAAIQNANEVREDSIRRRAIESSKEIAALAVAGQSIEEIDKAISGVMADIAEQAWPIPVPLDDASSLPQLSSQLFDSVQEIAQIIQAVAMATGTDETMGAAFVLPVLATTLQGKVMAPVKPHLHEHVAMMMMIASETGTRKSGVEKPLTRPIKRWEEMRDAQTKEEREIRRAEREIIEADIKKSRKGLKDGDEQAKAEFVRKKLELDSIPQIPRPRVLFDDVTMESLSLEMANQGGRGAILLPEPGPLATLSGRYGSFRPSIEIILRAYNGESIRVDRLGREGEFLREPLLSIGVFAQPDSVRSFIQDPVHQDRGLVARFAFVKPRDLRATADIIGTSIPPEIAGRYLDLITALLNWRPTPAIELKHSAGAWRRFLAFYEEHRARLVDRNDLGAGALGGWTAKLDGRVARIAALLHVARFAHMLPPPPLIEEDTATAAIEIGWILAEHARAIFGTAGADARVVIARRILAWIEREGKAIIIKREILRAMGDLRVEDVIPALHILEDHGHVRTIEPPDRKGGTGRKPRDRWAVNPRIATKLPP